EGFLGQLTGSLVWQNQGVMRLHGPTPNYEHPNSFSGMALGTMPFVFYLFSVCKRPVKGVLVVQGVFAATIVLFTGSRTGYLGFVGFVLCALWKAKRKMRAAAMLLLVCAVALPLIPADYVERFASI